MQKLSRKEAGPMASGRVCISDMGCSVNRAHTFQHPLIKEYTLNYSRIPYMI